MDEPAQRRASPGPVLPIAVGIILRDGRFLVARRRPDAHAGGTWEFPGGKQEAGETLEDALRREVAEETGLRFRRAILLHAEEHAYPERTVLLHFFLCLEPEGDPCGLEGQEVRWAAVEEIARLEVPEANRRVVEMLEEHWGSIEYGM